MLFHFETAKELDKLKVDFMKTDLDVALPFAQIASQTDNSEKMIRTSRNARKGYDAGLQFMSAATITDFEREILSVKLIRLKSVLLNLERRCRPTAVANLIDSVDDRISRQALDASLQE